MVKQATYYVNGPTTKYKSVRSFICALLVFLALCLAIYLMLLFVKGTGTKEDVKEEIVEIEVFKENYKSKNDKLTVVRVPDQTKKYEGITQTDVKEYEYLTTAASWPRTNSTKVVETEVTRSDNDIEDAPTKKWHQIWKQYWVHTEKISESTTNALPHTEAEDSTTRLSSSSEESTIKQLFTSEENPETVDLGLDHALFHDEDKLTAEPAENISDGIDISTTPEISDLLTTPYQNNLGKQPQSVFTTRNENLYHEQSTSETATTSQDPNIALDTVDSSNNGNTTEGIGRETSKGPNYVTYGVKSVNNKSTTENIITETSEISNYATETSEVPNYVSYDLKSTHNESTTEATVTEPSEVSNYNTRTSQAPNYSSEVPNSMSYDVKSVNNESTTDGIVTETSDVSNNSTETSDVSNNSTETSEVSNNSTETSDVSNNSTETSQAGNYSSEVPNYMSYDVKSINNESTTDGTVTETSDVSNNSTETSEASRYSTEISEVPNDLKPVNNESTTEVMITKTTLDLDENSASTNQNEDWHSTSILYPGSDAVSTYLTTTETRMTSTISSGQFNVSTSTDAGVDSITSEDLLTTSARYPFTSAPVKYEQVTTPPPPLEICDSTSCRETASRSLYLMNHNRNADPCEDFFDFACGGQKVDEQLSKRQNLKVLIDFLEIINATDKYLYDFKMFYESCTQHEKDFRFSERLEFLNDFPKMNLSELFAELILTQSMPLFDIGLDIERNSNQYIFELTLPGRSSLTANIDGWSLLEQIKEDCLREMELSAKSDDINLYYSSLSLQDCRKVRFRGVARNFVSEMMAQHPNRNHSVYNEANLDNLFFLFDHMQDMLSQDYNIREAQVNKKFNYSQIANINNSIGYGMVDWGVILRKLAFNGLLDEYGEINIYFQDYFKSLFQILQSNFTESELSDALWLYAKLQLYVNTVIPKEKENRNMYCMDLAKQLMPDTVSVITYRTVNTKNQHVLIYNIHNLFNEMKYKLEQSLVGSKMDDFSKGILKEKLKKITLGLITTGDYNTAKNNNRNVNVDAGRYQANVMELLRNYRRVIYSLENANVSAASLLRYFVDPFYTRPKSFYASNIIVIHTGFFKNEIESLPTYINLATIGMHLSRELARHFDPVGRQFVGGGNTHLSNNFYQDLVRQTKDLLYHYANGTYVIQGTTVDFQVPESLWINQMIADNAAFRIILDLFNDTGNLNNLPWISYEYPVKKVFFIAAAQEYCRIYTPLDFMEDAYITGDLPPPFRIQNLVSNSKEFLETFKCRQGSSMTLYGDLTVQFPNIDYNPPYDYYSLSNN